MEVDSNKIYGVFNIFDKIPNLEEILDVFKYMTPLLREKIVEYLGYAGLALAQDSITKDDKGEIRGGFAVLYKIKQVFGSLKLQQVQKKDN